MVDFIKPLKIIRRVGRTVRTNIRLIMAPLPIKSVSSEALLMLVIKDTLRVPAMSIRELVSIERPVSFIVFTAASYLGITSIFSLYLDVKSIA